MVLPPVLQRGKGLFHLMMDKEGEDERVSEDVFIMWWRVS